MALEDADDLLADDDACRAAFRRGDRAAMARVYRAYLPNPAPIAGARCDEARSCPDGFRCVDGECAEGSLGCTVDADCAVGVCHHSGVCVQCADSGDCSAGVCVADRFVCGCTQGGDCATGRCYREGGREVGHCASCYADAQCGSGTCDQATGICEDSSTSPMIHSKDPRRPRVCDTRDGKGETR